MERLKKDSKGDKEFYAMIDDLQKTPISKLRYRARRSRRKILEQLK